MRIHQNDFEIKIAYNSLFVRLNPERIFNSLNQWHVQRHNNAEYELHIILRGTCLAEVTDQRYPLSKGQALLIPPNLYHNAHSLPGDFLRLSIPFFLSEGSLSAHLAQQFPDAHVFCVEPEIERLCYSIIDELTMRPAFWKERWLLLLSELVICLFRQLCPGIDRRVVPSAVQEHTHTSIIDAYLEKNFTNDISLDALADLLHLSRRQTNRVLQENYGMNFRQKVLNLRMDRAAWLLRTTDMPMRELIGAVGYTSEAAFYQAFRSFFNLSPLQYRKQFSVMHEEI